MGRVGASNYCHEISQKYPSIREKQYYLGAVQSIENKVSARIYGNQRGWAFSKSDFLDLGKDADVQKALSGLTAQGIKE